MMAHDSPYDQGNYLSGKRRTMPSRDFLIRQAILNAAAECFPASTQIIGVARTLDSGNYVRPSGEWPANSLLFRSIPKHFRALVESYGGTTCPSP